VESERLAVEKWPLELVNRDKSAKTMIRPQKRQIRFLKRQFEPKKGKKEGERGVERQGQEEERVSYISSSSATLGTLWFFSGERT
jgi:hypothetical protein